MIKLYRHGTPGGQLIHKIKVICIAGVIDEIKIGYDNKLLIHNSADLNHFQETTTGRLVVMGSNTFKSLGCKPLANRINFVLTSTRPIPSDSNTLFQNSENLIFGTLERLIKYCYDNKVSEIYVIGGAMIYDLFINKLKCTDLCILSKFKSSDYPILWDTSVDAYFPKLNYNWECRKTTIVHGELFKIEYLYNKLNPEKIVSYQRNTVKINL